MKNKRKDVSYVRKLEYITLALREIELRPDTRFRTDVIGLACQFSSQPKLKREDFHNLINMRVKDFIMILNIIS
jgi:hypothetical protein